jgi:TPR repeat protein
MRSMADRLRASQPCSCIHRINACCSGIRRLWRVWAALGSKNLARTPNLVGAMFYYGLGMAQDDTYVLQCALKAAELGSLSAETNVG